VLILQAVKFSKQKNCSVSQHEQIIHVKNPIEQPTRMLLAICPIIQHHNFVVRLPRCPS